MDKIRPTIIAVDDNLSNIKLLEFILSEFYELITFSHPTEVVEHFRHSKAQLVLTDLVMPVMDGIELMKNIKKSHPEIPFIVLSAYDREMDIRDAFDAGAFSYLVKPINIPELFENIEKALKNNFS
jgi:CheY-like chemotaxis protein